MLLNSILFRIQNDAAGEHRLKQEGKFIVKITSRSVGIVSMSTSPTQWSNLYDSVSIADTRILWPSFRQPLCFVISLSPCWSMDRKCGKTPSYSFFVSNAPENTRLSTFVWLSGIRWAIEQCFEEAKTELGMDHYEVRKYPGWNHHMLVVMLAHFFLWHLKIKLGKKSSSYFSIAA